MDLLLKFIKFGIVGMSGMIVDFGFTWIFKEKLKVNKYIANSIGFVTAATSNYILNRVWTFKSHEDNIPLEFFSFFTVSVIGLLINNLIIYLLTEKMNVKFYAAKLIAIGVVVIWNFFANYLVTFRS
ncbi:GtrA family protein [Haoranjiania flava]|uniref:GtrA family protein n=1 Tax=Haoranjiania flava TaxID=1856322 RepID=A0AAE3LIX6_9BACT|nr:GtrA family protein [Haoranjiania flava]MCU7693072.1 GtrA family protein [Haoranjiania flava]